jgi:eukaryotic-like serine/threonine-protein kinase
MFVPISQHVVADRYELVEEIGRGSMGVIWRARQTNLGIECAIKFIHAAQAHDPELRRRFVREARAAASLKSPHSVHILDVDEWQGCLFIAMELLIGETLEARLERVGRLSAEATLEIVDQVARGLNKAHAARLVHRDLKPDNIFLVDDEPLLVKILDFGIAKRLDAIAGLQTASGALLGTPGYMSPEQALASKSIDYRSDLWSLAVVVFRCLTGVEPFDGDGIGQILVEIVKGPLKKPSLVNPHLPVSLDAWWLRATQREPAARHESATELVNDLRQALESQPIWPTSAFEPTIGGSDYPGDPPATLEPVLAAQRNSSPAVMRYSVAMVPALIVSGWFIGRALWSPSVGAWRDRTEQSDSPVAFAVAPVTATRLDDPRDAQAEPAASLPAPTPPVVAEAAPPAEPPVPALDPAAAEPASLAEPTAPAATTPSPAPAGTPEDGTKTMTSPSAGAAGAGSTGPDGSSPGASAAGAAGQGATPKASGRTASRSESSPSARRDPARHAGGGGGGGSAGGGGAGGGAASRSAGPRSRANDHGRNAPATAPPSPDERPTLDSLADRDELRPRRDDDFGIGN